MVNQKIVKIGKIAIGSVIVVVVFILGFVLGDGLRAKAQKDNVKTEQVAKTADTEISKAYVKDFLIAFYTKKTLEENRNRYQPFMTDGLYKATVAEEHKAVNQAYKGYIVDQTFEDASIYIDSDKKEILVTVKYKSVLLAVKNDYSRKTDKATTETIKLTYVVQNNKVLFNTMEKMNLTKAPVQTNSAPAQQTTTTKQPAQPTSTTKKQGGN